VFGTPRRAGGQPGADGFPYPTRSPQIKRRRRPYQKKKKEAAAHLWRLLALVLAETVASPKPCQTLAGFARLPILP
jgi:hypothetical protein